ncbi:MAG: hypothetical protein SFU25_05290 [Candidatus Caenarcaniphilales bacterium]|nr:hypothetical protein [Candidatus Caenarcaniphilales bacterium]
MVSRIEKPTLPKRSISARNGSADRQIPSSSEKEAMVAKVEKDGLPVNKILEAIKNTILHREKAGVNLPNWLTTLIPLFVAPTLMLGLTSRSIADVNLKNFHQPNSIVSTLRNFYPPAYSLMMLCGFLNGFAGYASISRMTSYFLLFLGSLYVWAREKERNSALQELARLGEDPNSPNASPRAILLKHKLAQATAGISAFARIYYCAAMSFTFLANSTQAYKGFKYEPCKARDLNGIWAHFRDNWKPNFDKELGAGWFFTKKIFSLDSWKNIGLTMAGKDAEYEQEKIISKGITNPIRKILIRLGKPEITGVTTMLNGLSRFVSVAGTAYAVTQLGGIEIFNDEDKLLQNPEIEKIENQKPLMKAIYDSTMMINNIGNAFMAICSLSTGFNPDYAKAQGQLSAGLQTLGATLHMVSVFCDTSGWFLFGQAFKLGSNACFQLANSFGAANKAVPSLIRNDLLTV